LALEAAPGQLATESLLQPVRVDENNVEKEFEEEGTMAARSDVVFPYIV
jgi:hypothetical protein